MSAVDIKIDLSEVETVRRALRRLGPAAATALQAGVSEGTLLMERETVDRTPRGAGGGAGLAASIGAEFFGLGGSEVEGHVTTPLPHAVPVEVGTRPHFPPVLPIAEWAVAKLGISGRDAMGVAYAVARKIARDGTAGAEMFRRTFDANTDQVKTIQIRRLEAALAGLGGKT